MVDKKNLFKYLEDGLVFNRQHPSLPLLIWNYQPKVQYDELWDDVTMACRGLITDLEGNIIVKPFGKFFNYSELANKNIIPWSKNEYAYIQEKVDGTLGILFYYENQWILASRGSFDSPQAIKGLEILKSKYRLESFETSIAYIGEIIYPENRIVCDYKKLETFKFISTVPNMLFRHSDNRENHWTTSLSYFKYCGIKSKDIIKTKQHIRFNEFDAIKLKYENLKNKEGYVIIFFPSYLRIKIKFDDYIEQHSRFTCITTKNIWNSLRSNIDIMETLKDAPDEIYNKVKNYIRDLKYQHYIIYETAGKLYDSYLESCDLDVDNVKYSEWVKLQDPKLIPILYNLNNRVSSDDYIWKMIKPKHEKIF